MNLSNIFKKSGQQMADYHMKHRGRLGLAFGLVAGIGFTYTGLGQETAFNIANSLADLSKQHPEDSLALLKIVSQTLVAFIMLVGISTDCALHIYRKKNQTKKELPKPD